MKAAVIYFIGQYNHLIKKRLLEEGLEVHTIIYRDVKNSIDQVNPDLIVLGGGPFSPSKDYRKLRGTLEACLKLEVPILGICLSHQLIAVHYGGKVDTSITPEYGSVIVEVLHNNKLFRELPKTFKAWTSHSEEVKELPRNLELLATSKTCKVQAFKHKKKEIYGVQFHPEVEHTSYGRQIFKNLILIAKGKL